MAAPPPPSRPSPPLPPSRFEKLPEDTQRLILQRIPCPVDRVRMSHVCRGWRKLLGRLLLQRPPPFPRLLLRAPFTVGGLVPSTRAVCVLSACRAHHYLNIVPHDARFFGSHKDAWIFLSIPPLDQLSAHIALNIRTRIVREFPRDLIRSTDPERASHRMVIHAAALSHSPEDQRCVGAAIVTSWRDPAPGAVAAPSPRRRCVALWLQGWPRAWNYETIGDGDPNLDAEDVTFMKLDDSATFGAFVILTQGEHIHQCAPRFSEVDWQGQAPTWRRFHYRPREHLYNLHVRARYLVMSSGELLMVVRFTPHPNQPTSVFKVFLSTKRRDTEDADANFPIARYKMAWSELDTLGDRILFVGHGCSRCYRASEYPGFKSGIYFLDDGKFYDDAVIFGNGNVRRYPCSDNGKWSEGHVQRCFPRPDPSDHSAPVWLLP